MALLDQFSIRAAVSLTFVELLTILLPVAVFAQKPATRGASTTPSRRQRGERSPEAPKSSQVKQPELAILNVTAPNVNTTSGANFLIPVTCGDTTGLGVVSF